MGDDVTEIPESEEVSKQFILIGVEDANDDIFENPFEVWGRRYPPEVVVRELGLGGFRGLAFLAGFLEFLADLALLGCLAAKGRGWSK